MGFSFYGLRKSGKGADMDLMSNFCWHNGNFFGFFSTFCTCYKFYSEYSVSSMAHPFPNTLGL